MLHWLSEVNKVDVENEETCSKIRVFWHISVGDSLDRVGCWRQIMAGGVPNVEFAAAVVQLEGEGHS